MSTTTLTPPTRPDGRDTDPAAFAHGRPGQLSLPGDINNQSRVLVVDSGDLTELLFFAPVLNHLKRR